MSRRSYNDIDAEIALRMANRSDVTPAMRGFFINDGYLTVASGFVHKELQLTTDETLLKGSDNFTPVATDIWFPTAMRNMTDGYIVRQDSLERIERAQTKPTSRPYQYYWYGGDFIVECFAENDKDLHIWYKRKPVDLVSNNGSELDQIFDVLIVMEATRIGFEAVRDFEEAEQQEKLIEVYTAKHKLPLEQAKLNDYRQGWKVRFK